MAAVFAPLAEVERILKTVDGYVVIANVNSNTQSVIGGASKAVEQATQIFLQAGYNVVRAAGQPRFPHLHRGSGQRAAAADAGAPASAIAAHPDRRQRERRVLSHGRRRRAADAGHSGAAGRLSGAVRQGPAHAVRRRRAGVRGGWAEEGAAGICRGCARRPTATWFRCSPIIPRSATWQPSTRRCAACMRRDWAAECRSSLRESQRTGRRLRRATEPAPAEPAAPIANEAPASPVRDTANGDRYAELGHLFADVLDRGWEIYRGEKPAPPASRLSSPARRWDCPEPSTSSTTATSPACCAAINSSTPFPRASAAACSTSTSPRLVKSDNGGRELRDHRRCGGRHQAGRPRRRRSIWRRNSASPPSAWPRSTASPSWRSLPASTPCAMPAFRWSCATRPPARARSCPIAGDCPTHLRDDTGVIFGSAFPGL